MPFTVWCNDRLVGETDLDYIANTSQTKFGDFVATDYGEQLIPILMAPRQAVCAQAEMEEIHRLYTRRERIHLELRAPDGSVIPTDHIEITDLDWLLSLSIDREDDWQSDIELAEAELMEELHPQEDDESERLDVLPPEWFQQEIEEPDYDEFDTPALEFGDLEDEPTDFPRYQIQVAITNGG